MVQRPTAAQEPPESNVIYESLVSYGHYKIFASGSGVKLYTSGVEYDRHSWGYFLHARMDYAAEVLPVVLLSEAKNSDVWGTPLKGSPREMVPGFGFSPLGFRMVWMDGRRIQPFLVEKAGMIVFPKKVLSSQATYENFSLQETTGVLVRVNDRMDLRLGLFGDFHFSNAFMVPSNPGVDVMNASLGVSYRLGSGRSGAR
jgi:hypothetical protein